MTHPPFDHPYPETRLQRHNPPHRLSRGGDRQTNQALYLIAGSLLATDPATRAYRDRRLSDPDPHATTTSKDVRRGPLRQPR